MLHYVEEEVGGLSHHTDGGNGSLVAVVVATHKVVILFQAVEAHRGSVHTGSQQTPKTSLAHR